MPIPDNARCTLSRRLDDRRRQRWSDLTTIHIRYRASFAYIAGTTEADDSLPLCRLRYLGTPDEWGFAAYLASRDSYEDSLLPTGSFTGTPEEALDCVCGLYLGDITAWIDTPDSRTNF